MYKRQDKDRVKEILSCMNLDSAEEFKNILAKILGDKEKFEKEELELYAEIAQNAGGTLTVSYTHLDVYKRQRLCSDLCLFHGSENLNSVRK